MISALQSPNPSMINNVRKILKQTTDMGDKSNQSRPISHTKPACNKSKTCIMWLRINTFYS